ncbi:MAG: hypothetical protein Sylvanvirus8_19 [Sylvanvirus sp.]|uniref:Uncharacterized protein n=1 Tax=Sylvanvirus sp. TaxID=2487774 RepID=A0A3G5AKH1_9VIRU|nr:MAG: hypothetical protein Sylvanvirus8_19 [Sylvanvirus sp.]
MDDFRQMQKMIYGKTFVDEIETVAISKHEKGESFIEYANDNTNRILSLLMKKIEEDTTGNTELKIALIYYYGLINIQVDKSEHYLLRSLQKNPALLEATYHLGTLYENCGKTRGFCNCPLSCDYYYSQSCENQNQTQLEEENRGESSEENLSEIDSTEEGNDENQSDQEERKEDETEEDMSPEEQEIENDSENESNDNDEYTSEGDEEEAKISDLYDGDVHISALRPSAYTHVQDRSFSSYHLLKQLASNFRLPGERKRNNRNQMSLKQVQHQRQLHHKEALRLYQIASTGGYPRAVVRMSYCYYSGCCDIPKDISMAHQLLEPLIQLRHPQALYLKSIFILDSPQLYGPGWSYHIPNKNMNLKILSEVFNLLQEASVVECECAMEFLFIHKSEFSSTVRALWIECRALRQELNGRKQFKSLMQDKILEDEVVSFLIDPPLSM